MADSPFSTGSRGSALRDRGPGGAVRLSCAVPALPRRHCRLGSGFCLYDTRFACRLQVAFCRAGGYNGGNALPCCRPAAAAGPRLPLAECAQGSFAAKSIKIRPLAALPSLGVHKGRRHSGALPPACFYDFFGASQFCCLRGKTKASLCLLRFCVCGLFPCQCDRTVRLGPAFVRRRDGTARPRAV